LKANYISCDGVLSVGGRLNVYDGNVYLSLGNIFSIHGEKANWFGFPTGGMYQLLGPLSKNRYDSNIVVFDSRSKRKDLCASYKSNRVKKPDVIAQGNVLAELLPKAGFMVVKRDGYEGDDLIKKIVKDNYNLFQEINIYTVDMDLASCIDEQGRVIIHSPTTQSHNVNRASYEQVVVKDRVIPYNSILPYKVFFGDSSDTIAKLPKSAEEGFNSFLNTVRSVDKLRRRQDLWSERAVIEFWLNCVKDNLSKEEIANFKLRFDLIYPMAIEENLAFRGEYNSAAYKMILNQFGMKRYIKLIGYEFTEMTESEKKYLSKLADNYRNGFTAVDSDLPPDGVQFDRIRDKLVDEGTGANTVPEQTSPLFSGENVGGF
jgi:5'-3' exonuclease